MGGGLGLESGIERGETKENLNIYKLIQEKENDLVLAAELGKALLDKNEEISQHRERIVLDYTQKLEVNKYVIKYFL